MLYLQVRIMHYAQHTYYLLGLSKMHLESNAVTLKFDNLHQIQIRMLPFGSQIITNTIGTTQYKVLCYYLPIV